VLSVRQVVGSSNVVAWAANSSGDWTRTTQKLDRFHPDGPQPFEPPHLGLGVVGPDVDVAAVAAGATPAVLFASFLPR
jgi:hypothetical protein